MLTGDYKLRNLHRPHERKQVKLMGHGVEGGLVMFKSGLMIVLCSAPSTCRRLGLFGYDSMQPRAFFPHFLEAWRDLPFFCRIDYAPGCRSAQ